MFRQRDRDRMLSPRPSPFPAAQLLFDNLSPDTWSPNWEDLVLPKGRSVNSCRRIFQSFRRSLHQGPTTGIVSLTSSQGPNRKRSAPPDQAIGRPLAPKQPATFAGETRGFLSQSTLQPMSPLGEPAPGLSEPRKKRGRPTKKEQEERRKQHEERNRPNIHSPNPLLSPFGAGGPQTAHRIPIDIGPSGHSTLPLVPMPLMTATPRTLPPDPDNHSSSSSGKKRRGRPKAIGTLEEPLQPPAFATMGQTASSAYSSPPHSAPISARERRSSVSTRSAGAPVRPPQQEQRADSEDVRQARPRTWNDTVMGQSSTNPRPS
ncbi:hypothetical protein EJ08DRAFT_329832 [Tothia fuscella]|uniref:Uncharacterized protein n=1 Tax=Tothia fuscella TaxID=1048955 RepID=A0A9P4TX36_9PEZI|nr:hypothetical protein EJ08DRAFT_329832 [Tothia fuscella]